MVSPLGKTDICEGRFKLPYALATSSTLVNWLIAGKVHCAWAEEAPVMVSKNDPNANPLKSGNPASR
jgi:hypothetical protein